MRYLLDTNIISDVVKPKPSEALLAWMAGQADQDLYISSMTVAEISRRARIARRQTPARARGPFFRS
jgi:predicted nucleic acid-binding protein